jgi:hypothetical protein
MEAHRRPRAWTDEDGWQPMRLFGMGIASRDLTGDGHPEVYLTNQADNKLQTLVEGPEEPRFRDIAIERHATVHHPYAGGDPFPSTAWHAQFDDVNNDGYVDLLLVTNGTGHLYVNDGDGTFTYRQSFSGRQGYMGGFADLDNDGDLDLVFAGDNRVLVNDGTGSFPTSVSFSFGDVNDPRSIAFADIDNDGDLDFFVTQKFATNRMIRNDYSGSNKWLEVRLISPQGQAGAFGAKVRAYVAGTNTLIASREARGAYGYVAQDDPVLHFGLGAVQTVDIVVTFLSGSQRVVHGVAANRLITVGP